MDDFFIDKTKSGCTLLKRNKIKMENTTTKNIQIRRSIDESYIIKGICYDEYRRLINALIMIGKSTAKKDSENLLEYSKLNVTRMNRLDKTIELIPELEELVEKIDAPQTWLTLTEGWCGDAAQIVPVFEKIAQLNSNIDL